MKLQKITVKNFASYYGETHFDLSVSQRKPIVIFVGDTGYGKTSLFDAINWTLYGEEYEKELPTIRKRSIEDFVHTKALREAAEAGKYVEMSGRLDFEHNERKYSIVRSLKGLGTLTDKKPAITELISSTRLFEITREGNAKAIEAAKTFLDDMLPSNVRSYFLFDGDRIYNLTNSGDNEEVRDAIYKVVDLEIIQNSIQHFRKLAYEYNREAQKKSTGELEAINTKYLAECKEVEELKKNIEDWKTEEKNVNKQIDIIDEKLIKAPESARLQEEKKNRENGVKDLKHEIHKGKLNIKDKLPLAAYGLVRNELKALQDHINKKRERGEIPKYISETLIKDLLEMRKCICDKDLDEKMSIALHRRLEQEKGKSGDEQQILEIFYGLQNLPAMIDENKEHIGTIEDEINEKENNKTDLEKRIQEIDAELDGLPQENIEVLRARRKILLKDRDEILIKLENAKRDLDEAKNRLKYLKEERLKKGKQQKEVEILQMQAELADRSASALENLYADFAELSRDEVEKLTREEFSKFVYSAQSYTINITKDFDFEVLDLNGYEALQRLSMGQRQCLSLAFILAISKVSQKNPPIVYDMPFGRLSSKVNNEIIQRLPHLAEQLILFLIPGTEWNESTQIYLREYCSHIYELEFDGQNLITTAI